MLLLSLPHVITKVSHVITDANPTLTQESVVFETICGQTLGHIISPLFLGINFLNVKGALRLDVGPEVMPLDQIILGPAHDALIGGKEKHPIVVLEDSALDSAWDL